MSAFSTELERELDLFSFSGTPGSASLDEFEKLEVERERGLERSRSSSTGVEREIE